MELNNNLARLADLIIAFEVLEPNGTVAFYRLSESRILVRHNAEDVGVWDATTKTFTT